MHVKQFLDEQIEIHVASLQNIELLKKANEMLYENRLKQR